MDCGECAWLCACVLVPWCVLVVDAFVADGCCCGVGGAVLWHLTLAAEDGGVCEGLWTSVSVVCACCCGCSILWLCPLQPEMVVEFVSGCGLR